MMELLRILFVLGCLSPSYFAMEIHPSVLPRNLDVYCKICEGISTIFDGYSYDDYDFWRTFDIHDKVRLFCSICKKTTESTTLPNTSTELTTSSKISSEAPASPTSETTTRAASTSEPPTSETPVETSTE